MTTDELDSELLAMPYLIYQFFLFLSPALTRREKIRPYCPALGDTVVCWSVAFGYFILAAIITPTFDPINQNLVAAPLILLYEMSIWLAKGFPT